MSYVIGPMLSLVQKARLRSALMADRKVIKVIYFTKCHLSLACLNA